MSRRILQIIPADSWQAVYSGEKEGTEIVAPLVCFALVEIKNDYDGPDYEVVPMDWNNGEGAVVANDALNFLRIEPRNPSVRAFTHEVKP